MIKRISTLSAVAFLLGALPAIADPIGILSIYEGEASLNETTLASLDCTVARRGQIIGQQGPLDVTNEAGFAILSCAETVIGDAQRRQAAMSMFEDAEIVGMLEGDIMETDGDGGTSPLADRLYIMKLGYYNNIDPDLRERELTSINDVASGRDGAWRDELQIAVDSAIGMPTPDEVVVLHYDSPQAADAFRSANPDVLQMVGQFNGAHLTNFVYLVARASQ